MKKEYIYLSYFGIALIIIFVIKSMFGKKAKEKKQVEKSKEQIFGIFTPEYYDWYMKKYGRKWNKAWSKEAESICHKIWSAKGTFVDNDSQALAYARMIRNKGQASLVNKYFRDIYKLDLMSYLTFLDKENFKDFMDIINKLKEY
jgi:hypothetical protein